MNWQRGLEVKVKEPLKKYTTFKIGGPVEYFIEPKNLKELRSAVIFAGEHKVPLRVLGAGSNILVSDKGITGLVLRLNSAYFKSISFKNDVLVVRGGLSLNQLLSFSSRNSISGFEFLAGIPGTLGGALIMNAGAWGKSISGLIKLVKAMDRKGRLVSLGKNKLKFRYRKSNLSDLIVIEAVFKAKKGKKILIRQAKQHYLSKRFLTQDNSFPNAGCIFRNPRVRTAGELIEFCRLKGKKIGGAQISRKHANFILNRGHAGSEDILRLIRLVQESVEKKFKIRLEPEIKIWQ